MRLVTLSASGRTGVGVRRDGVIVDTGYADMHDLIRDGADGLARAAVAAESGASAPAAITLEPGDLVSTGTPAGVGCFKDPPVYLQPGDTVTVSVDCIGDLTNPVVARW